MAAALSILGYAGAACCLFFIYRIVILLYNWARWLYRRQKYYSDAPLLSGMWQPFRLLERSLQDVYNMIVDELADKKTGALPAYWDRGFFGGGWNALIIVKPDDQRAVMNDLQRFPKPPELVFIVGTMLGNEYSLVLSEGEVWRRQRKMLSPVFHSGKLISMFSEMERQITHFSDELLCKKDAAALASAWHLPTEQFANPIPLFERVTLKIILAGCFGQELDLEEMSTRWTAVAQSFYRYAAGRFFLGRLFDHLPFEAARTMTGQIAKIREQIGRLVVARRKNLIENPVPADSSSAVVDLLALMMLQRDENGQMLSDEELVSQSLTIMFAGHETTSSALSWCSYYLGLRPDIQDRCFTEIKAFRATNELLTTEQLRTQFPLITAVFNESLRMAPPAPQLTREVVEDTVLPSGVKMKAGDRVVLGLYQSCMDGEFWEDPRTWNPDRWLAPDFKKPFFPVFLTGARNCLGERFARLESVLALVLLLERFLIEIDPTSVGHVQMRSVVTTHPTNLRVRFHQR